MILRTQTRRAPKRGVRLACKPAPERVSRYSMDKQEQEELSRVLALHAKRYPLMRPCDAVKLIYQNEFGGGHMIADPNASLERLRAEYGRMARDPSAPRLEEIGNGVVRVMLPALEDRDGALEELNRVFVHSARRRTGTSAAFREKLELLRALTRRGAFGFSGAELEAYLEPYIKSGCPPASHSPEYRQAYRPAYRVVLRDLLPMLTAGAGGGAGTERIAAAILERAKRLPQDRRPILIAIDGRCASGKTTLAARLRGLSGCGVVHMDDFFLRPEQRTRERYDTPGGNVDHERFLAEVLLPLREGRSAEYRPFNCRTQRLEAPIVQAPAPLVVAEGSYACHPKLWNCYDLRVFLTVNPEEQMRRISARNGTEYAAIFRDKWIPLEEQYFAAYQIERRCDCSFAARAST